jgi:tyrosine decarboxylase/aspartate 1-decarboxylase
MRENGCPEEELFSFLAARKADDIGHEFILSSMCTVPHPVAVRAHDLFMIANLGDPGLFPGASRLEQLLIERIGTLLHLPGACGYATSGGTESNIQALRIARARKTGGKPNVVVPASAHFSFKKACDLLSLEMKPVPLDREYRMNATLAAETIDRNTCCLVGVAGTTEYGMVDPIGELSRIAHDYDVHFHVDAAFGGLVLPFLPREIPFDFGLPGVTSIAVDPHKMGMSTIPCGCLLVRDPDMMCALSIDTPYLTVKQEFTLSGTRPGGPVAGAFAVLEYLGCDGMRAMVAGCMENTRRLLEGLSTFGIEKAVTPDVNVATFAPFPVPERWHVSTTRNGHIRIVCMPHVNRNMIEAFIREIGEFHAGTAG